MQVVHKPFVAMRQRRSASTRSARSRTHGALLVEALIALFVGLLTGSALLELTQLTMTERSTTMNPANSDAEAQVQLSKVSDSMRDAQPYISGSNTLAFSAASASSITAYTDTSGDTVRTWLNTSVSPAALEQTTTTGGVATTTVLLSGVTSLQFTYYKEQAVGYNAPLTGWLTTTSPSAPTTAERPQLGAARIVLTVTVNGAARQLSTLVRFRNSPYQ